MNFPLSDCYVNSDGALEGHWNSPPKCLNLSLSLFIFVSLCRISEPPPVDSEEILYGASGLNNSFSNPDYNPNFNSAVGLKLNAPVREKAPPESGYLKERAGFVLVMDSNLEVSRTEGGDGSDFGGKGVEKGEGVKLPERVSGGVDFIVEQEDLNIVVEERDDKDDDSVEKSNSFKDKKENVYSSAERNDNAVNFVGQSAVGEIGYSSHVYHHPFHSQFEMSLAADSPVHSSSSDDLAAFLDAELDTTSDASADLDEVEDEEEIHDGKKGNIGDDSDYELDKRFKWRKVELSEGATNLQSSSSQGESTKILGSSPKKNMCPHPGAYAGMCMKCGQKMDEESGVAFGYIHKNLRLANDEITRLRDKDLKNLLRHRKLYLILDLDHTLLNSAWLSDITMEEGYLNDQQDALPDAVKGSLFRLDRMHMMTKLRPFVHAFLKGASNLFEMYIYTMGERPYALEMAKLLDPADIYFNSRIIAQGDCTQRYKKGLDVVLGQESAVLILDDTEAVWGKHKENLILMERYHFFASSCKHFGFNCKSLSELRSDESETEGALATVLKILQQVHNLFFDQVQKDKLEDRDVRQVLKTVRREVLDGCKVVFSRVFPTNFPSEHHHLWKMAEQLGATCTTELDQSITHVVSMDAGTDKSRWAVQEKKFLVHPRWIEASNYMWKRQPEGNFPVSEVKTK